MPDTLLPPLSPATNDQRRRWATRIWQTIHQAEAGQTSYWTGQQLRLIVAEIEPPLLPNGDPDTRCTYCSKPADTIACGVGGCPLGADL